MGLSLWLLMVRCKALPPAARQTGAGGFSVSRYCIYTVYTVKCPWQGGRKTFSSRDASTAGEEKVEIPGGLWYTGQNRPKLEKEARLWTGRRNPASARCCWERATPPAWEERSPRCWRAWGGSRCWPGPSRCWESAPG